MINNLNCESHHIPGKYSADLRIRVTRLCRYCCWQCTNSYCSEAYRQQPFVMSGCFRGVFNTLRPRQNGRDFADDIFKCIFLNENVKISIKISLKFVPKGLINNIPALVQIMAWRRSGDKPLSEPMMVSSLTLICVTRPQWVNEGNVITIWYFWNFRICISNLEL